MTRQEKKDYVVREDGEEFVLGDEQEKVKYLVMQEFVRLRKERGITQDELSKRTGIARPNIARMENGSYNPTIEMLCRMAAGIGMKVEINWLEQ